MLPSMQQLSRRPSYLCQSRALHIFDGPELARQFLATFGIQGALFVLRKLFNGAAIFPQVHLRSH